MMKKAMLTTGVVLALLLYGYGVSRLSESKNSAGADTPAKSVQSQPQFTVKQFGDKVAVFIGDEEIPIRVFDINTAGLREYDRQQLKSGIELGSMQQVLMLIEDLSS